jgi:hypothetical protein
LRKIFGELRRPLLARQNLNTGIATKPLSGPLGKPGANTIVAAQRVAAGEDEAAGGFRNWHELCAEIGDFPTLPQRQECIKEGPPEFKLIYRIHVSSSAPHNLVDHFAIG